MIPSGLRLDADAFRFQFKENPFSHLLRIIRERLHLTPGKGVCKSLKFQLRFELDRKRWMQLGSAAAVLLLSCAITYYNWDSIQLLMGVTPPTARLRHGS